MGTAHVEPAGQSVAPWSNRHGNVHTPISVRLVKGAPDRRCSDAHLQAECHSWRGPTRREAVFESDHKSGGTAIRHVGSRNRGHRRMYSRLTSRLMPRQVGATQPASGSSLCAHHGVHISPPSLHRTPTECDVGAPPRSMVQTWVCEHLDSSEGRTVAQNYCPRRPILPRQS